MKSQDLERLLADELLFAELADGPDAGLGCTHPMLVVAAMLVGSVLEQSELDGVEDVSDATVLEAHAGAEQVVADVLAQRAGLELYDGRVHGIDIPVLLQALDLDVAYGQDDVHPDFRGKRPAAIRLELVDDEVRVREHPVLGHLAGEHFGNVFVELGNLGSIFDGFHGVGEAGMNLAIHVPAGARLVDPGLQRGKQRAKCTHDNSLP